MGKIGDDGGWGVGAWKKKKMIGKDESLEALNADIHRGALEEAKCVQHVFLQQLPTLSSAGQFHVLS